MQLKRSNDLAVDDLSNVIGLFRSKSMAKNMLEREVKNNQLCHRLTGFEKVAKAPVLLIS